MVPFFITGFCIAVAKALKKYWVSGSRRKALKIFCNWIVATFYGSGTIEYEKPLKLLHIGAIWFLPALLVALIIVRFLMRYRYGYVISILLGIIAWKLTNVVWLPMSIQSGMLASIYVYAGFETKRHDFLEQKPHPAIVLTACLIWLYCIKYCGHFYIVRNHLRNGIIDILGGFAGTYLVLLFSKLLAFYVMRLSNALAYIGRHTLAILCFHCFELKMIRWNWLWNMFGTKEHLVCSSTVVYTLIVIMKLSMALLFVSIVSALIRYRQKFKAG